MSRVDLGTVLIARGRPGAAEPRLREALRLARERSTPSLPSPFEAVAVAP